MGNVVNFLALNSILITVLLHQMNRKVGKDIKKAHNEQSSSVFQKDTKY